MAWVSMSSLARRQGARSNACPYCDPETVPAHDAQELRLAAGITAFGVLSPDTLAAERRARPIAVEEQRPALAAKYQPSGIPCHGRKVIRGYRVAIGDAVIAHSVRVDMSLMNGAGPEAEGDGASGRIDIDCSADIRMSLDRT